MRPDALKLLRRLLAAQPDGSVTLVQVGYFSNFAALLDTPADEISPLKGVELVRRKVKLLSVMAGAFQTVETTTASVSSTSSKTFRRRKNSPRMAHAHRVERL
jgi:inosine-uridine nucleoside N-ribohydrolase